VKARRIISQLISDWPGLLVELGLAVALVLGRKSEVTAPIIACLFVGWAVVRRIGRGRKYKRTLE
jgi:hypothetical protein